jgi:hypothetical protein
MWAQKQPPPTFYFVLASNIFFVHRTLSMRQKSQNHRNQGSIEKKIRLLNAKNAIEKFSCLGTFKAPTFYVGACIFGLRIIYVGAFAS